MCAKTAHATLVHRVVYRKIGTRNCSRLKDFNKSRSRLKISRSCRLPSLKIIFYVRQFNFALRPASLKIFSKQAFLTFLFHCHLHALSAIASSKWHRFFEIIRNCSLLSLRYSRLPALLRKKGLRYNVKKRKGKVKTFSEGET